MTTQTSPTPAQFTVLFGDDVVSRESARIALLKEIEKNATEVTPTLYDSTTESFSSFLARFVTLSLFAETRVFQIRHADLLSEQELDELSSYLAHEVPDAHMMIEAESVGKKKKGESKKASRFAAWLKAFEKKAKKNPQKFVVLGFPKPRDYEVPAWVIRSVPSVFDRTISKADAEHLVDMIGTDLGTLNSELQKIDLHLPAGLAIDRKTIDHISGANRTMSPYELAQALGQKDLPRALEVTDALFSTAFYAPLAISAIFRHFWGLFRIRKFAQRFPDDMQDFRSAVARRNRTVQDRLGVRIGVAAGLMKEHQASRLYPILIKPALIDQARSFKDNHLTTILRWLYDFDIGSKTGKIEVTQHAVQLLCCKIVRVDEVTRG